MRYGGPRTFNAPPELRRDLERLADQVDSLFVALTNGTERRWRIPGILRADGALSFGDLQRVDTTGAVTINLHLPTVRAQDAGREIAIRRMVAAGTINLVPPSGADLDGSLAAVALPGVAGTYILVFDGIGFSRVHA